MEKLNIIKVMQMLAKAIKKPCMYINTNEDIFEWEEIIKAAPYLKDDVRMFSDGIVILTFDDEKEMDHYYKMTVGDDGPTELNNYDGEARVYALTCSANGELMNENT